MTDRETILWRRLDLPGHETAQLFRVPDGWKLSGVAVLVESDRPCRIDYAITCDAGWRTRSCVLRGYVGSARLAHNIVRAQNGEWTVDGRLAPHLAGCEDIDLGFSPATNLLPIRRLELKIGACMVVRAAWVRFPEFTIEVLEQVYTRVAADRYHYESAGGRFQRDLRVDTTGFVEDYPELWVAEARTRTSQPNEA